jgi:CubicO group peptidase (beta-lactamase class C family)
MTETLEPSTPEAEGLSSDGLARIDAAVRQHIDAGTLAGAVTLVARHGRLVHLHAMGERDIASHASLEADTLFRIFSMTKPVTGVAMMILYDEGLWTPDDPIHAHLPEFADVRVFAGVDEDGVPILVAPDHAPTMRELMTHTAGLIYGIDGTDPVSALYREARLLEAPDLADMSRRMAALPLAYQPGSEWRYSLSMDLQGAVIERLTGQPLAAFMAERIFAPLGMVDTAFHIPPEKRDRLATLYYKQGDGPLIVIANPFRPDHDSPPALALGGGGLISTASDYARFAQMLLDGGKSAGRRIVSAQSLALMMTNHLPDAMLETRFKAGHHRFRPGFGYGFNGVVVTDPRLADLPVGKGSYFWDGAAGTWFWVDPVNDLLFVGMVQMLSYTAPPLQEPTQRLMADALS